MKAKYVNTKLFNFFITLCILFGVLTNKTLADSLHWIDTIKSGQEFKVIFNKTSDKFDDSNYTGNTNTDPMGSLKGGETYSVKYIDGSYTCTGYNQGWRRVGSMTYSNAKVENSHISMWGRIYVFDGVGNVYDSQYGLVGELGGNFFSWKELILSHKKFLVKFDNTSDKFDDSRYSGANDPMGTLKGGETYSVIYTSMGFTCTGFNQGTGSVGTWTYSNANPSEMKISLWGRVYEFTESGDVLDIQYGHVGHLCKAK